MRMMRQRQGFVPAKGRTPGDGGYPVAVSDGLPDLPPRSDDVVVGVIDIGLSVDGDGRALQWFGDHVQFDPEDGYVLPAGPAELCRFDGHADFVTGLILRESPTARVVVRGALDRDDVNGRVVAGGEEDTRVANAISQLADSVQVINLSFCGDMFTERREAAEIQKAVATHSDVAFVAAAGNDGGVDSVWPAAFDGVYAVGAVDEYQSVVGSSPQIASFSNHGRWVDVFAGGVLELSSFPAFDEASSDASGFPVRQHFAGWARWSGTSFAAARVSGRIASIVAERGCTGRAAADALVEASPTTEQGVRWVGGAQLT
jgi:subtilisin family serine protease